MHRGDEGRGAQTQPYFHSRPLKFRAIRKFRYLGLYVIVGEWNQWGSCVLCMVWLTFSKQRAALLWILTPGIMQDSSLVFGSELGAPIAAVHLRQKEWGSKAAVGSAGDLALSNKPSSEKASPWKSHRNIRQAPAHLREARLRPLKGLTLE